MFTHEYFEHSLRIILHKMADMEAQIRVLKEKTGQEF